MIVLGLPARPGIQVVTLDDPTYDGAARFAQTVAELLPAGHTLLWHQVTPLSAGEHEPNKVAALLLNESDQELTPSPQSAEIDNVLARSAVTREHVLALAWRAEKALKGEHVEHSVYSLSLGLSHASRILAEVLDRLSALEREGGKPSGRQRPRESVGRPTNQGD